MTSNKAPKSDPSSFLPLHPTVFFILLALFDGPKHGYAVAKAIEQMSEGTVRVAIGNLYVSMKRLVDQKLIERDPETSEDERRKTYRLTDLGANVFQLERNRIGMLSRASSALPRVWQGAT